MGVLLLKRKLINCMPRSNSLVRKSKALLYVWFVHIVPKRGETLRVMLELTLENDLFNAPFALRGLQASGIVTNTFELTLGKGLFNAPFAPKSLHQSSSVIDTFELTLGKSLTSALSAL